MKTSFPSVHPTYDMLEEFSSETEDAFDRRGVARHIAGCVKCQDRVRAVRDLRRRAATLPSPPMKADLLARIQHRAAQGELVMLSMPADEPRAAGRRRSVAIGSMLAASLILVWLIPSRSGRLEAGASGGELRVAPKTRTSPSALTVRYRPAPTLAGADSVILRGDLYAPRQYGAPSAAAFTLRRRDDGSYAGDASLPSDAVLARFTVTAANGNRVDDNDGRQWELVVADTSGRPRFEGLDVQSAIHGFDDWEQSYAAALEMLRFYPDNPRAVRSALTASLELRGAARADSVVAVFRPRVDALHREYATATVSADLMWEMAMLASRLRDRTMYRYWLDRTKREFPRSPEALQLQTFGILDSERSDAQRLAAMDSLWDATGGGAIQLASEGFNLANKSGDPVAVERWGERFARFPGWSLAAAGGYLKHAALRAKGETILRESVRKLPPVEATEWRAALGRRQPESEPNMPTGIVTDRQAQWPLATLGEALLADGKAHAARDTLRRAVGLGWNTRALAVLGDAELAAGDSAAAITAYGWAIADPRTDSVRVRSIRQRIGQSAALDAAIAEGRQALREMTLRMTYRRAFNTSAELADADGRRRRLSDVLGPGLTVVAVVSRTCAPSLKDLPWLQAVARRFGAGARLVTFVEEAPNHTVQRELAEHGFTESVLFDDRAEASRALRQFGTPHYYLIEDGRTIRADVRQAADLVLIIDALRQ
jgi:hypothetical protein